MKQNTTYSRLLAVVFSTSIVLLLSNCQNNNNGNNYPDSSMNTSQQSISNKEIPPKTLPDRPHMWVDMVTSGRRVSNYIENKQGELSDFIKADETSSIFFPRVAFTDMINYFANTLKYVYLRIYIVNYDPQNSPTIPSPLKNKLSIVFAPITAGGEAGYFTIPEGTDTFDPTSDKNKIDNTVAQKWIESYTRKPLVNSKMKILARRLKGTDLENYEAEDLHKPLTDTRSVLYVGEYFSEIITEMDFQTTYNHNDVTGVMAQFAAIGRKGLEFGPDKGKYKNRLILQFELTKPNGNENEIFYIDTTHLFDEPKTPFADRGAPVEKDVNKFGIVYRAKAFDNGQLCPANCPK